MRSTTSVRGSTSTLFSASVDLERDLHAAAPWARLTAVWEAALHEDACNVALVLRAPPNVRFRFGRLAREPGCRAITSSVGS